VRNDLKWQRHVRARVRYMSRYDRPCTCRTARKLARARRARSGVVARSRIATTGFRAANDRRMAIVVHLHANISQRRPYGAREARVLCWAAFRQLPLSDAEFRVIGENVAPYMK
jgi:hypothetical protein